MMLFTDDMCIGMTQSLHASCLTANSQRSTVRALSELFQCTGVRDTGTCVDEQTTNE